MIEVEIEFAGDEPTRGMHDPASVDVADVIRARALDFGTTVTIFDTRQEHRQLLIALSGGRAFVGLVSGEQQYQLADPALGEGDVEMTIGGQIALIASRFSVDPAYAAQAAVSFMQVDPIDDRTLVWILQ